MGHRPRRAHASGSPAPAPASSRRAPRSWRCSSTAAAPRPAQVVTPCSTSTGGRCSGPRPSRRAPSTTRCSTTSPSPSATAPRSRWPSAPAIPTRRPTRLLDRGVELALVKMGGEGVLVATSESRDVVSPHPVEVVCGLGAGDAFGGALVHGLLAGWDPVKIAGYANAAGAIVASRLACADAMPTLDELRELVVTSRRIGMSVVDGSAERPGTSRRSPTPSGVTSSSAASPTRAPLPRRTPPGVGRRGSSPTAAPCSWSPPTTRRVGRWPRAGTRWRWPTGVRCSPGWSRPCGTPTSTACSARPTSSRSCCCSACSRTRS